MRNGGPPVVVWKHLNLMLVLHFICICVVSQVAISVRSAGVQGAVHSDPRTPLPLPTARRQHHRLFLLHRSLPPVLHVFQHQPTPTATAAGPAEDHQLLQLRRVGPRWRRVLRPDDRGHHPEEDVPARVRFAAAARRGQVMAADARLLLLVQVITERVTGDWEAAGGHGWRRAGRLEGRGGGQGNFDVEEINNRNVWLCSEGWPYET